MLNEIFNLGLLDNIWVFAIVAMLALALNTAVFSIQRYSDFKFGIILCMIMDAIFVAYVIMRWVL